MHRIIWYDRMRIEKKKVSLTHVLGKIVSFTTAMRDKYKPMIDTTIPIHQYAQSMMKVLLSRMHVMVLHRYVNNRATEVPNRIREIVLGSGIDQQEAAVELEKDRRLQKWKWYNGAHQQWHTSFLLLVEIYQFPNRKEADRIWDIVDFVFQPDLSLSRVQKARTILGAIRDRTAIYRDIRRMRAPLTMRAEDVRRIYAHDIPPDPKGVAPTERKPFASPPQDGQDTMLEPGVEPTSFNTPISQPDQSPNANWTFESPSTMLFKAGYTDPAKLPGVYHKQQTHYDTSQLQPANISAFDFGSPSASSGTNESWPPLISNDQVAWRPAQMMPGTNDSFAVAQNNMSTQGLNARMMMSNLSPRSDDSPMLDIDWVCLVVFALVMHC